MPVSLGLSLVAYGFSPFLLPSLVFDVIIIFFLFRPKASDFFFGRLVAETVEPEKIPAPLKPVTIIRRIGAGA